MKREWSVTVQAWGRILTLNVEAATKLEAEAIALATIGFSVEAKEIHPNG